jgi:hypothetical protein
LVIAAIDTHPHPFSDSSLFIQELDLVQSPLWYLREDKNPKSVVKENRDEA